MTIELNREAIAQVAALPAVTEAAEAGSALISLWPLTEAMQMDNDAKYAENLQVRVTRAFARILTGEDVTVPDAEFVYEGADEIPGRPQSIVDALLAANDAYDTIADYAESGDARLIVEAADVLGIDWDSATAESVREAVAAMEAQVEADAEADGRLATSAKPADVAVRFATALAVCDALLGEVSGDAVADGSADSVANAAAKILPILLYVNELREQCSVPRICLTDEQILGLLNARAKAADADTLTATAEYIAPLAVAEWNKHREDVLWNPDEAKRQAKEEDEKRNKEALAAKFAHVKDDPGKETVEL
ncbi:hypothetical protein [Bifidobacterium longum]|uniref:hypothetical protein n=1 Tax=Bifidobacterium longum TaxID=216816 RepID=UPI0018D0EAF3|nr:hypothetical protein [Bifidobacterium longum]MBH0364266.1 hypothetical protein [Bifidobacterium longum]MBM5830442.1 hypothetical protein [Bifidobacterium longum subsp. suillum]QSG86138.1 hypothetical protein BLS995_05375 [Bifidobacterium longum subsp. suillum]QXT30593.1 hypothetical protein BLS605_06210 [Bifidobacterium longum subsp. suillum]